MAEAGIANVWLCDHCGRFEFTKPESDEGRKPLVCAWCNVDMQLLADQAVIQVRAREGV